MRRNISQVGDTIIEVVLSMGLLTSVLFIAWGVTNRATQILATARDRTLMVNSVKEQAEIIKAQWSLDNHYFASATTYPATTITSTLANPCAPSQPNTWYLSVDPVSGAITKSSGTKVIAGDATKKVWVQRENSTGPGPTYTDFYVRACWQSQVGGGQKDESTQVLVRLNT